MTSPRTALLQIVLPCAAAAPILAQGAPGVVDYTPEPPPTATYPIFVDIAPVLGTTGTVVDDPGSGRGQCIADLVGPDPLHPGDPTKVGPPDGIPDIVQTNSDSPALPLGAKGGEIEVPAIGPVSHASQLLRGAPSGLYADVAVAACPFDPAGWNIAYPGGSPWGVLAFDREGDGDLDLFYSNGGFHVESRNTLMEALGDGTFRNATLAAGFTTEEDARDMRM